MQKIANAVVRAYLADGYWETGVLRPYFEDPQPDLHLPMFFRSDNCYFDPDCRCYVFKLPEFHLDATSPDVFRHVYIPERFIVGLAVKHRSDASEPDEDMSKIGFVKSPRASRSNS